MKIHLLTKRIVVLIPFVLGLVFVNSVLADSLYWGSWVTKEGIKPNIKINIKRKKRTKVMINGQARSMDYSVIEGKHGHLLLEFHNDSRAKSGKELETDIYLVGGRIGKDFVLRGFYFSTGYNQEGVEKGAKLLPVTLYLVKRYEWDD